MFKIATRTLFDIFWLSTCLQFNRQAPQGNEAGVNVNVQGQPGNPSQPGNPNQSIPQGIQIPLGAGIAIPTLATVVIR